MLGSKPPVKKNSKIFDSWKTFVPKDIIFENMKTFFNNNKTRFKNSAWRVCHNSKNGCLDHGTLYHYDAGGYTVPQSCHDQSHFDEQSSAEHESSYDDLCALRDVSNAGEFDELDDGDDHDEHGPHSRRIYVAFLTQ